jgi:hypothetical protein
MCLAGTTAPCRHAPSNRLLSSQAQHREPLVYYSLCMQHSKQCSKWVALQMGAGCVTHASVAQWPTVRFMQQALQWGVPISWHAMHRAAGAVAQVLAIQACACCDARQRDGRAAMIARSGAAHVGRVPGAHIGRLLQLLWSLRLAQTHVLYNLWGYQRCMACARGPCKGTAAHCSSVHVPQQRGCPVEEVHCRGPGQFMQKHCLKIDHGSLCKGTPA